jgi:hypothetical protein
MGSPAIAAIAEYHNDVERSLRFYFSEASPAFRTRFIGLRPDEALAARDELIADRLEETDQRSAFFILTSLEAAFRVDYEWRCQKRMKDDLSRAFRAIHKSRKAKIRLDEDIFEAWRENFVGLRQLIGELRGAFKFRHWLAHGRYREPKLGRKKYDFTFVYSLADDVLTAFPFETLD